MKAFESIKEFYKPIQPTVKTEHKGIVYQEIHPEKNLENFVYCFWQLKTRSILDTPFVYQVVSDGCIDIFFDKNLPSENFVMGFCRKYTEFSIGKTFNYIGIRFLPSAFPLLFGVNAKDLSNKSQELKLVLPEFASWINTSINTKQSFEKIIDLLNSKLFEKIKNRTFDFDARFFKALNLILKKKGVLETESDLTTGLSPRQLRRIFNFYIGTTPKAFSKVIRFQHILNAKPSSQSLKENKLFYDAGFYDQAHFIKDFKNFYGVTPTIAFQ
ncbi:AraC family transcriptional regulator [Flavivirga eckloniae]|uniref:AraC family transcriptional regulator n=1 Tax=Flavivirga eckloniae TaxID=1803846 RepID=A0A2K9PWC7_9FLAO|nr:helix-turn-helix domain-containing protein [Flavivirga eckloniae]AUP81366.1 AraC family transcriptional regulator [Flavivirga eckloniae]